MSAPDAEISGTSTPSARAIGKASRYRRPVASITRTPAAATRATAARASGGTS